MSPTTEQHTNNCHKDDAGGDKDAGEKAADSATEPDSANTSTTTPSENPEDLGAVEKTGDSVTDEAPRKAAGRDRRISVSVRSLAVGTVIIGLIVAVGVMTWLYLGATTKLDDQARQADGIRHAEQIALDYAVNAAIMDYKDLGPWKQNLVKGTSPELNAKLTKAATAMEQILLPLQWGSSAHPLAAKVRSHDNGVYVVDAFVSVMTKTAQTADGVQSTATYSITIDSNNAWLITDVGGIANVVDNK
jgi:Mce-associated membrane protein